MSPLTLEFISASLWMRDCEAAPGAGARRCADADAGAQLPYETFPVPYNACPEHMPCLSASLCYMSTIH